MAEQPGQTAVFYKGQYNRLKSFPRKLHFIKINISQARACFGKLLIREKLHESLCLILINQNTQFQQVRAFHFGNCFDSPSHW